MSPQLPPEILEQIFVFTRTSSGLPSLRACFQVNPMFASLVEPHIWYHLTIENLGIQGTAQSSDIAADITSPSFSTELGSSLALQLLIDKPHIAGFIRSLTISIGSLGNLRWYMTRSLGDEDIAHVLPLLPHLERVVLTDRGYGKVSWVGLDVMVRNAFLKALGTPSMREVGICRIEQFPLEELGICSSLERLELEGSFIFGTRTSTTSQSVNLDLTVPTTADSVSKPNSTPRVPSSRHRAYLKSLTLRHCTDSLMFIVAWLYSSDLERRPDISRLIHLKATLRNPRDYEYLPYILSSCERSLEVMEVDPGGEANLLYDASSHKGLPVRLISPSRWTSLASYPQLPRHFFEAAPTEFTFEVTNASSAFSTRSSITVSLPTPFSLRFLASLRHLRVQLLVEDDPDIWTNDMHTRDEDLIPIAYATPFEWVKRVCDELAAPPLSAPSQLGTRSSSPSLLSLERLEFNISFNMEPANVPRVSWAPLADALSILSSSVPSVKSVDMRVIWAGAAAERQALPVVNVDADRKGKSLIVQILEEDTHLGPFVRQGLVKIMDG